MNNQDNPKPSSKYQVMYSEMTLLDYFAAQAIAGFTGGQSESLFNLHPGSVADTAYAIADAMLVERKKRIDS